MKLPYLPVKDTVNLMNAVDIYQLSLASKRKRALIKFMNFKIEGLLVKLYHQRSAIHFWKDDMYSFTPAQAFYSKEADFQPIWQPEIKTLVSDHSAECLTMATRLSSLFRLKSCIYWLIDLKKTPKEMNQILSRVLSESCTEISIMEHQWINDIPSQALIDEEVLEYLMNNAKLDTIIRIFALFPDNFKHENVSFI
ncbi:hypothetical protein CAEBREN_02543 [Caenorhabditis brenneri]|uniref:F-box domain-containing protein n=1 Tax=Caenorhabditis brenneri TaxID=135651 RepID=G0MZH1_CAEBE|nr:hypothetical protein CAEBREN_02543 [Caenorhabditis brenneri]